MINTSSAYKNTLYNGHRNFIRKATIYLADNTVLQIADADIWSGGFKFDAATTSSGTFDIGAVIIEKFTMVLNNIYETYSQYDFYDATIWAYAGLVLDDGTEEWFRKGVYTVKEPDVSNGIITLVCYDNVNKFDTLYSNSSLIYPATRQQIVADICQVCGVTNNTGEFDGFSETVDTRPEETNLTCRDVLGYIAQISGLYGRCDNTGGFKFAWYESIQYDEGGNNGTAANLDGGNFTDYSSGDTADGGDFLDYSSGDIYDGGLFFSGAPTISGNFHNIYSTSSSKVCTDDITITGIKVITTTEQTVTTQNQYTDSETGEVITETSTSEETVAFEAVSGTNEYMLVISDNPLVNDQNAQAIADHLFAKIGGLTIRPMTLSALGDPSMEAGDAMIFTDRKGNSYTGYITTLSYAIGQYASLTCDAESPLTRKNNADTYSQALKNAIEMENIAKKQATRYAQAVDQLNQLAANALGFYETTEVASDGSKIVYMHDKPTLEESEIIYKKTIDGFFISRDGGKTYTAGFDSNGNAVLNILSAIGINFDWAYGGTLTLGGSGNGNGILNIVDEAGNTIVRGDNTGLVICKGTIAFSEVYDEDGTSLTEYISSSGLTEEEVTVITENAIKTATIGANQIYGNALTLGGHENTNGFLLIKDAAGNIIVKGDNTGLTINEGTISWANVTDKDNVANKDDIPANTSDLTNDSGYITSTDADAKIQQSASNVLEEINNAGYQTVDDVKTAINDAFAESGNMTEEKVTEITKTTVTTSYVDALAVTAKAVAADWIYSGEITATQISGGTFDATNMEVQGLIVGENVTMGSNVTLSWSNITDTDGIFGTRNYVRFSGNYTADGKTGWEASNASYVTVALSDGYTRITRKGSTGTAYARIPLAEEIETSTKYTVSMKVRRTRAAAMILLVAIVPSAGNVYATLKTFAASDFTANEWVLLTYTFETTTSGCNYLAIRNNEFTNGEYIDFEYIKLEKGTVATDWTPAPEDLTESIPDDEYITQITKNTVTTSYVNALDITAKNIAADAIKSSNYSYSSGDFSAAGTFLDLSNGALTSKNFSILSDGSVKVSGEITAVDKITLYRASDGSSINTTIEYLYDSGSRKLSSLTWDSENRRILSMSSFATGYYYLNIASQRLTADSMHITYLSAKNIDATEEMTADSGIFSKLYSGTYYCTDKMYLSDYLYMGDNSDNEKFLYFTNKGAGTYAHNSRLYGGNGESKTAIGLYDELNDRAIWRYNDVENIIDSGATLAYTSVAVTRDVDSTTAVTADVRAYPFLRLIVFKARFTTAELEAATYDLGSIPSTYAPSFLEPLVLYGNTTVLAKSSFAYISTAGTIRIVTDGAVAAGKYVYLSGAWNY